MLSVGFKAWTYKKSLFELRHYESRHAWIDVKKTVILWIVFVLNESVLQVQVQGSTLEIEKALSGRVDVHLAFSLCFGIMMAWYNFIVKCLQYCLEVRSCLTATVEADADLNKEARWKVRASIGFFTCLVVVTGFLLFHGTVKVYMVTLQCDCGWNLGSGCVPRGNESTGCPGALVSRV